MNQKEVLIAKLDKMESDVTELKDIQANRNITLSSIDLDKVLNTIVKQREWALKHIPDNLDKSLNDSAELKAEKEQIRKELEQDFAIILEEPTNQIHSALNELSLKLEAMTPKAKLGPPTPPGSPISPKIIIAAKQLTKGVQTMVESVQDAAGESVSTNPGGAELPEFNQEVETFTEEVFERFVRSSEIFSAKTAEAGSTLGGEEDLKKWIKASEVLRAKLESYQHYIEHMRTELNTPVKQKIVKNCLEQLDQVIAQYGNKPISEIGHFSNMAEIVSDTTPDGLEQKIRQQVETFLQQKLTTPIGALASPSDPGKLIPTTLKFSEGNSLNARVCNLQLQVKDSDIKSGFFKSNTINVVSVQKSTSNNSRVTELHTTPSDLKRLTTAGCQLVAITKIREHLLSVPPNQRQIMIRGDMPEKLVKEMMNYCHLLEIKCTNLTNKAKGYNPEEHLESMQRFIADNKERLFKQAIGLGESESQIKEDFNKIMGVTTTSGSAAVSAPSAVTPPAAGTQPGPGSAAVSTASTPIGTPHPTGDAGLAPRSRASSVSSTNNEESLILHRPSARNKP